MVRESRAETIARMEKALVDCRMPGYTALKETLRDLVEAFDEGVLIINKEAAQVDIELTIESINTGRGLTTGRKLRL